jgi:3-methyl-2-oxobutanoate hydroxymethyltransferase
LIFLFLAGAFAIVLEGIPADLSYEITNELEIPTIGIGAGADCDGQILVINDLLGLSLKAAPSFVKQYANLAKEVSSALRNYATEVRTGVFPANGGRKSIRNGQRISRI